MNLNIKIKKIIQDVPYQKLILFGSYARSANTKNSDIDLLFVMKDKLVMRDKITLATNIRKKFAENNLDVDVIIKNNDEFKSFKNKLGSVVYHAVKEGKAL